MEQQNMAAIASDAEPNGGDNTDVESGSPDMSGEAAPVSRGLFPIEICWCPYLKWIPKRYSTIQDLTHLFLVLAIISSFAIVIFDIVEISFMFSRGQWAPHFPIRVMSFISLFSCGSYFALTATQYDDGLQARRDEAAAEQQRLEESYNKMFSEGDEQWVRMAKSTVDQAQRAFKEKQQDFLRFLRIARTRLALGSGDQDSCVEEFRRFVKNWLSVFQECSTNPKTRPCIIGNEKDLAGCHKIEDICAFVQKRLDLVKVEFMPEPDVPERELSSFDQAIDHKDLATRLVHGKPIASPWFRCARCGCGCFRPATGVDADYFFRIRLGCLKLDLLSRPHMMLVTNFFLLPLYAAFELADFGQGRNPALAVMLGVAWICVFRILFSFKDLDKVEQLVCEIRRLQKKNDDLAKMKVEMDAHWSKVQRVSGCWLHRTVPRLNLMKDLHYHLETVNNDKLNEDLLEINNRFERLECAMGPVDHWIGGDGIREETQQQFSRMLANAHLNRRFSELLGQLDDVVDNGIVGLRALDPNWGGT